MNNFLTTSKCHTTCRHATNTQISYNLYTECVPNSLTLPVSISCQFPSLFVTNVAQKFFAGKISASCSNYGSPQVFSNIVKKVLARLKMDARNAALFCWDWQKILTK